MHFFFLVGFNNIESADTPAHRTWWNKYIGRRWTNSSNKVTIYTTKHRDFSSNGKTEIFSFFPYAFAWKSHPLHSSVAPPMWADWWGRGQWNRRKCGTKQSVLVRLQQWREMGRGWAGYQNIRLKKILKWFHWSHKKYEVQLEPRVFLHGLPILWDLLLWPPFASLQTCPAVPSAVPLFVSKKDNAIHEKVQKMPWSKCPARPFPALPTRTPL